MSAVEKARMPNVISKNISFLMGKHGMTTADLSKKSGVIYMTASRIVSGQTPDPKISNLIDIAGALNVTVDNLIYSNFLAPEIERPKLIPVISIKDVTTNLEALTASQIKKWLVTPFDSKRSVSNGLLVAISGSDIASSLFHDDSIFIIGTNIDPENGDYVLVNINNSGPSVKKFHYDPPHNYLTSISTKSSIFKIEENTVIIGVGAETIMEPVCVEVLKE